MLTCWDEFFPLNRNLVVGWRSLIVTKPARLSRDRFSLRIEQDKSVRVPFEDIAVIVLDHNQIMLTHPVLTACSEYGIAVFSTNDAHQPAGVFTPFLTHSRATRFLRLQMGMKKPLTKQIWAAIIRTKIINQAYCLDLAERRGGQHLRTLAEKVRSGDSTMMESRAACFHFSRLFGHRFTRSSETWINAALNYGYAIVRGAITRGLVAHGFFPSLGLHHASEQNAFNLADDIIEPFRPMVDLHVATHVPEEDRLLAVADKAALVSLLNTDIQMPQGLMSALSAIEQSIESLARAMEYQSVKLLELPKLVGLEPHQQEE